HSSIYTLSLHDALPIYTLRHPRVNHFLVQDHPLDELGVQEGASRLLLHLDIIDIRLEPLVCLLCDLEDRINHDPRQIWCLFRDKDRKSTRLNSSHVSIS